MALDKMMLSNPNLDKSVEVFVEMMDGVFCVKQLTRVDQPPEVAIHQDDLQLTTLLRDQGCF